MTEQNDGRARTIGAVSAILVSLPLGRNLVGFVEGWAVGRDDLGNGCAFRFCNVGRVNGAGVVTGIGTAINLGTRADPALSGATAVLISAADAVQIQVTGVAGRTIQWGGELTSYVSG